MAADDQDKWYYHVSSGQVSRGKEGSWQDRMGPYDSAAEAREALKKAEERNQAFDDDEDDWNN